ncbi:uncharacterized protein LOC112882571 [Panicum hallii]|uniref:uncharacterized protein LOC112882571 n=1 Tax=Panicum hallii TaxID=206008 RepID=UPI000DF4EA88|nr:uncharacterized protein LOC112882571 [Panicum hallii]
MADDDGAAPELAPPPPPPPPPLPSYPEMILEAIDALDNDNGSNKTAISGYLKGKYIQNPRTKFVFVCFSARILSISIFSRNPSRSKIKFPIWSKVLSCFGCCLTCSNCTTNVSCCGTSTITNNYGGQNDGLARNFTNKKESESQASASKQAALPDLISI